MPRKKGSQTKRELAMQYLEQAQLNAAKALSLLGGKVVYKPRTVPAPATYVARQHIESVVNRINVTQAILSYGQAASVAPADVGGAAAGRVEHLGSTDAGGEEPGAGRGEVSNAQLACDLHGDSPSEGEADSKSNR